MNGTRTYLLRTAFRGLGAGRADLPAGFPPALFFAAGLAAGFFDAGFFAADFFVAGAATAAFFGGAGLPFAGVGLAAFAGLSAFGAFSALSPFSGLSDFLSSFLAMVGRCVRYANFVNDPFVYLVFTLADFVLADLPAEVVALPAF